MAEHVSHFLAIQHIDRLPRSLVQGVIVVVFMLHALVIILIGRSVPLVSLGNANGYAGTSSKPGSTQTLYVAIRQKHVAAPSGQTTPPPKNTPIRKNASVKQVLSTHTSSSTTTLRSTDDKKSLTESHPVSTPTETPVEPAPSISKTNQPDVTAPTATTGNDASGKAQTLENGNGTGNGYGNHSDHGNSTGETASLARPVMLSQLRYKKAVKPVYPERAIQRYETGDVHIRVVVDTSGRVHDARVIHSSGFKRLDEAALDAARNSTFYPYQENGRPLFAMAIIPYRFHLDSHS